MLVINLIEIGDLRDGALLSKYREAEIDKVLDYLDLPAERVPRVIAQLVAWSHDAKRWPFAGWPAAVERANLVAATATNFGDFVESQPARVKKPVTSAIGSDNATVALLPTGSGSDSASTGKLAKAKLTATWSNCGKTGAYIVAGLAEHVPVLRTAVDRPVEQPVRLVFGRTLLERTLTDVPADDSIRLLDCSFTSLHTFLLEIQPGNRRYLHQGYQGGYFCTWWQGTEDAGLATTKPEEIEELTRVRARYGLRRPIADLDYQVFVAALAMALRASTWAEFTACWRALPFCPTRSEVDNMLTRGGMALPELEITSYTVKLPTDPPLPVTEHGSVAGGVVPARIF